MEQIDVSGGRATGAKKFNKKQKVRQRRRLWKTALAAGTEPTKTGAYESRYRGWMD